MTDTDLDFPFPEPELATDPVAVAAGLWRLRLPLPFRLDHVNVWLIEEAGGTWSLVDTGFGDAATADLWETLGADTLGPGTLARILVTHFHPDHAGQAGSLAARHGAPLWMSRGEWAFGRMLSLDDTDDLARRGAAFYRRAGMPEAAVAAMVERGNPYRKAVRPIPASFRRLADGDRLTLGGAEWTVLTAAGHSPEHVLLHCPAMGVLIAGDQVLPKISPNIAVWPSEPEAEPLSAYLASLERLRALPADTLVLPSHGPPFRGLHARLDALAAHHAERLEAARAVCARPASVAEATAALFRRELDRHEIVFAYGEALAHLRHLEEAGRLVREIDGAGVLRFAEA
ncbi:MAG: MBL fold metallo-hydrolase [Azospirillaceae bacterium]